MKKIIARFWAIPAILVVVFVALTGLHVRSTAQTPPGGPPGFSDRGPEGIAPPGSPMGDMASPDGMMPPDGQGPMGRQGPGNMRRMQPGGPPVISGKDEAELLDKAKSDDRAFYDDIMMLKKRDRMLYSRILHELFLQNHAPEGVKDEDPDMTTNVKTIQKLNIRELILGWKYNHADTDAERKSLGDSLRSTMNDIFDMNLKMRQHQISLLEKRIAQVKSEIDERKAHKADIIQKHFEDVTSNDSMRW